jgi:hypothetical protein
MLLEEENNDNGLSYRFWKLFGFEKKKCKIKDKDMILLVL